MLAKLHDILARVRNRLTGADQNQPAPRRSHNEGILFRMSRYDMMSDPDEPHYAEQYLHWIKAVCLPELPTAARVLDVGCGQGRLALPVAQLIPSASVLGVDLSPDAIGKARDYAAKQGLHNVEFVVGDAMAYVAGLPAESCDLVLFAEVAFWFPKFPELLREIRRVTKPGGFVVASFWSRYYRLLKAIRDRQWDKADLIVNERSGQLSPNAITFTWQTTGEVDRVLRDAGFDDVTFLSLGACSGVGSVGDALSTIAQPSLLVPHERARLQNVELAIARQYPENGRYILGIARKPVLFAKT